MKAERVTVDIDATSALTTLRAIAGLNGVVGMTIAGTIMDIQGAAGWTKKQ